MHNLAATFTKFTLTIFVSVAIVLILLPRVSNGEILTRPMLHQAPEGFVKLGKPLVDWSGKLPIGIFKRLQAAENDISAAADCLSISESDKVPSNTKLDWAKIKNIEALEVCLFRVASFLRSPDDLSAWLQFNGFFSVETADISNYLMRGIGLEGRGIDVRGGMEGEKLPPQIAGWIWFLRPHSLSLSISLFTDGRPFDVAVGCNYK